ncbi:uncharacterized protein LOC129788386 [Lutzomyia longipalpis]|uniref:uncharacterized protein LOC129788386 n=1 Tax=Lutzomyia longipalpis TaxID=7200 RepID=UPI002483370A|nr:uncharacterized protein LOC129788386 [Lutzomyia longipalpis]
MRIAYREIIEDQKRRQWIEPVRNDPQGGPGYYMPHHGVLKESSATTKWRMVYNASAKTSTGYSLNDLLRIGPVVQPDLIRILLGFRQHQYAMTADISKMYPQLMMHPIHLKYQQFVWRDDKSQPIQDFRFTRVCFGVASSPFLATRALLQLANEHQDTHPLAAEALRKAFYVDDCILSVETLSKALEVQSQLIDLLKRGGFLLTKWTANHPSLQPTDSNETDAVHITDPTTSALGLMWYSNADTFTFQSPISMDEENKTKREILSAIARLFDPLGLIGPVVIEAKILMQEAHKLKQGWDDVIPTDLALRWEAFVVNLQHINQISVPRWVSSIASPVSVELHAFSDASQRAYGAAVYIITRDSVGTVCSRLLVAKSRVAPIKALTIPKLELTGAVVAAELMDSVRQIYKPDAVHLWTDSTIVLYWINGNPEHFKVFVSNRIRKILQVSAPFQWRHVPTECNPADLISRGVTPQQLQQSTLWWNGPAWLIQSQTAWPPEFQPTSGDNPHAVVMLEVANSTSDDEEPESLLSSLLSRHSSISKIQSIIALCLRFMTPREHRRQGVISALEHKNALDRIIYMSQREHLAGVSENILRRGRITIKQWKTLNSLTPFVDPKGLIRVGGRLENADIPYQAKHPILLPKSKLSELIVQQEHLRLLHAGPNLLLATLRQRVWPLDGRNLTRKIVHSCVRCSRANPRPLHQLMGDLPSPRVNFESAFHAVGIDFAGPIYYRPAIPRGAIARKLGLIKAYIAVFVCMSTKAVHLEVVTNLSTEAFIAAFRRFAARKTTPSHVYSDGATNFQGAARELITLLDQEHAQREIIEATRAEGTTWHFIPARSPHFGGLWEACVKSVKYHLARVLQHSNFTFEELNTILCQIEAILNNRPISRMSDDPNENDFLTPRHLLGNLQARCPPDPDLTQLPENRLDLWQLCQQRAQLFGKKFRLHYLNILQQRSKWTFSQRNVSLGEIVLFLDETKPGHKWVLGEVVALHPGRDGRVRVVNIRTRDGVYNRAITKCNV